MKTPLVGAAPRDKRRTEAKRAVQAVALDLFEESGFDPVTMEQIAEAAGVGVATLYRYFGTKEQVVLWDEYDPPLFEHVAMRSAGNSAIQAAQAAIRERLDAFYADDSQRILRRARLVATNATLHAGVLNNLEVLRTGLVQALTRRKGGRATFEAEVAAGAVVACLRTAIDAWVRANGRPRLGRVIDDAFASLRVLCREADQSK